VHYLLSAIAYMVGIYFVSALSGQDAARLMPFRVPDYVLHGAEFAGLALLWYLVFTRTWNFEAGKARWLALGIAAVYGLLDEYHQSFVPGREPSVADWIADVAGAAAAVMVAGRRMRR